MSGSLSFIDRLPVVRTWSLASRRRVVEAARFLTVGGINYVVDVGVFNVLRLGILSTHPVSAKVVSVAVASVVSWILNRSWTFSSRAKRHVASEFIGFMAVNAAGLLPPVMCLWVTHYLIGWSSALADNISGNIVGVALGTLLRYVGYSAVVFNPRRRSPQ